MNVFQSIEMERVETYLKIVVFADVTDKNKQNKQANALKYPKIN